MENQHPSETPDQLDNFFDISFDTNARTQLRQAALWAKICALCAFIGYGVALIVAVFGHKSYSTNTSGFGLGTYVRASGSVGTVLVSAIIGGFINYFLYKFSVGIAKGVQSMDSPSLNNGFNSLRVYFKIFGVILIICLSLAALAIIIGVIAAAIGR